MLKKKKKLAVTTPCHTQKQYNSALLAELAELAVARGNLVPHF